ncbi:hypothetical protein AHAS_Ahas11G0316700 [Arachis hypogaea]
MTDLKLSSLVTGLQKPETCCQRGRIWLNMFSQRRNQPMQSNMKIIYVSRTFLSIIGGVVAGILGLQASKDLSYTFC